MASFAFRPRIKTVLQSENMECGLACLTMVAQAFQHKIDLPFLRSIYEPTPAGMTFADIIEVADRLGLDAQGFAISNLDELGNLALPAILHWRGNHFVVLERIDRGTFHVHDPGLGHRKYQKADLERLFSGVALDFSRRLDFAVIKGGKPFSLWKVLHACRGLKDTLGYIAVTSIATTLFSLGTPIFLQSAVDVVIPQFDLDLLTVVVIGLCLFMSFEAVSRWLRELVTLRAATAFQIDFTRNVVGHTFRLPLRFFEARHPGDFLTRLGSIEQIKTFLVTGFVSSVADGAMSFIVVIMMFYYSTTMALVSIGTLVAAMVVRVLTFSRVSQVTLASLEAQSEEQGRLLDGLRQVATLKAHNSTEHLTAKWSESFLRFANASVAARKLSIDTDLILHLVFMCGTVATLYIGVGGVLQNTLSIGVLYAFFALRGSFFTSMNSLILMLLQLSMMRVHLQRLDEIVSEEDEEARGDSYVERGIRREVGLHDVTISFQRGKPVVTQASLTIDVAERESIAIIGPSGSGKSSLLKVLASLNNPAEGTLVIDGRTLDEFGRREFRSNIGCVFAEDSLFAGTVAENIAMFAQDVSRARMEAALRQADLLQEVQDLPQGFATMVSNENAILSTGQRRRLILARALCRRPKLLLLDEVTANLDAASERRLIDTLFEIPAAKIFVTHSPEVTRRVDRVYEVQDGRLRLMRRAAYA